MAIFYIGGESASGKSEATKEICKKYPISSVALDSIFNIVQPVCENEEMAGIITNNISEEMINILIKTGTKCIVEGGWIKPEKAYLLRKNHGSSFTPIYCGYPRANAQERLYTIQRSGHWLTTISEPLNKITKFIEGSKWYKSECEKYEIEFIDFSDFDSGKTNLVEKFEKWN